MVSKKEIMERLATGTGLETALVEDLAEAGAAADVRERRRVYYQGDPAQGLHLVLRGSFDAYKNRTDGNARLHFTAMPGMFCGLAEVLTGSPYLHDLQSRENGSVFFIQRKNLLRLMETSASLSYRIAVLLAEEVLKTHENLEERGPREKILSFLKARVESFGAKGKICRVEITQEQLAELVGYSRETVNRHLQELESENRIALARGAIEVGPMDAIQK